jgi:hypothetical protein
MALVTVKLTVSQLVHGRMLPVGEPVQVPESFAAEFIRRGFGTIVSFGEAPPAAAPPAEAPPAEAPPAEAPPAEAPPAEAPPSPKPAKKGKR